MRSFGAVLLVWAFGCGDDDGAGADGGARDAGSDGAVMRPDRFNPCLSNCTSLPPVMGSGEAPREPDIDPAEFETGEMTIAFAPEAIAANDTVFPLGVQAGAMRPASVLLWTKVEGTEPVMLRVWREAADPGDVVLVYESMEDPTATDGYIHATAGGLAPATFYSYAFFTLGAGMMPDGRSTIGRVRTAPAPGMLLKTRVATATCTGSADVDQRNETAPWPALSHMAMQDIDLLLQLGDFSYNDNEITEADYRDEWASTLREQGYRDILRTAGQYVTWDDHEVTDNYDPETLDATRLETAKRVFFENTATERGPGGGLWNSYVWGDTAEFFVLDLRSERRPSTQGTGAEIFISPAQMTWLKERLMMSTAHFKVVLSSVNITGMNDLWDAGVSLNDRWEGYPAQRTELLSFIDDNAIANVWFLAGDIHLGFISRLEPEGDRFSNMWELTIGPTGSGANPLGALYENMPETIACAFQCDMMVFVHGRRQVSTILELDPVANTIRATYVDVVTDEVLFDDVLQQEPLE